jgi:hypothetical protein
MGCTNDLHGSDRRGIRNLRIGFDVDQPLGSTTQFSFEVIRHRGRRSTGSVEIPPIVRVDT